MALIPKNKKKVQIITAAAGKTAPMDERSGLRRWCWSGFWGGEPSQVCGLASRCCPRRHGRRELETRESVCEARNCEKKERRWVKMTKCNKLRNYELSRLPPNVAVITWKTLQFLAWVGTLSGRTKNKPILTKEPVWFSSIFYLFVSIFNFDSFLWRA